MNDGTHRTLVAWTAVEWGLFATWVADAALVMAHKRVPFLTSHAADLAIPAWLYVTTRSRTRGSSAAWRRALAAAHPLILASTLFVASAATEVSQYFWPHGAFRGVFDPLDIAAYATGLAIASLADLRWPIPARAQR